MTSEAFAGGSETDRRWSAMMAAAQAGDRASYEAVLRDCVPYLKRVIRSRGVRVESVDDVVQDVLLAVHRARQTYDPSRSFTAWLSAIAQRRAIDWLRHRGRLERRETSDEVIYEAYADQAPTPESAWEEEGRQKEMREAVAALPAGQREAVDTLAIRQLSLREAALATGKTKGALKVNMHRALKAMRDRFGEAD